MRVVLDVEVAEGVDEWRAREAFARLLGLGSPIEPLEDEDGELVGQLVVDVEE